MFEARSISMLLEKKNAIIYGAGGNIGIGDQRE
jgi:hypothetical protein